MYKKFFKAGLADILPRQKFFFTKLALPMLFLFGSTCLDIPDYFSLLFRGSSVDNRNFVVLLLIITQCRYGNRVSRLRLIAETRYSAQETQLGASVFTTIEKYYLTFPDLLTFPTFPTFGIANLSIPI